MFMFKCTKLDRLKFVNNVFCIRKVPFNFSLQNSKLPMYVLTTSHLVFVTIKDERNVFNVKCKLFAFINSSNVRELLTRIHILNFVMRKIAAYMQT